MIQQLMPDLPDTTLTATADANGTSFQAERIGVKLGNIGFQIIATGLNTADATIKLQHSNDGTNWSDVAESTLLLASGSSNQCMILTNQSFAYYRAVFAKGTNSAGTFRILANFN